MFTFVLVIFISKSLLNLRNTKAKLNIYSLVKEHDFLKTKDIEKRVCISNYITKTTMYCFLKKKIS